MRTYKFFGKKFTTDNKTALRALTVNAILLGMLLTAGAYYRDIFLMVYPAIIMVLRCKRPEGLLFRWDGTGQADEGHNVTASYYIIVCCTAAMFFGILLILMMLYVLNTGNAL